MMEKILMIAAILSLAALPIGAEDYEDYEPASAYGLRLGFGIEPEQIVVGSQVSVGSLGPVRVVPSLDVGFGDNMTIFAINTDFYIRMLIPDIELFIYGGVGPTIIYISPSEGDSDWRAGLSVVLGSRLPTGTDRQYNVECRMGIGKLPDLRIMVSMLF